MGINLKPQQIRRKRDLAMLLIKHGHAEFVIRSGLAELPGGGNLLPHRTEEQLASDLAADLEQMGPTYVKIGQLLSTRGDLLSQPYLEALARLQDQVEPFPYEEVEKILIRELGVAPEVAFARFDQTPIASGSLGQVHRAALRNGAEVVVKVQRPDVRNSIQEDFQALHDVAYLAEKYNDAAHRFRLVKVIEELRGTMLRELNYREEANNIRLLRRNLFDFPHIYVPQVYPECSTQFVLVVDYVDGTKIPKLSPGDIASINGQQLTEELFTAYLQGFLIDGFFHADPHPGNVLLTSDNRLALIDLGMVGWFTPGFREQLVKLLLAISEGRGDDAAEAGIQMGEPGPRFNRASFVRRVGLLVTRHRDASVEEMDAGRVVLEMLRIAAETDLELPQSLTLMSKALLNLDKVGHVLAPGFSPNATIRKQSMRILENRLLSKLSPGRLFEVALETTSLLESLPSQLNTVLTTLARNELKLNVDTIDEVRLLRGMHKIANRISAGVVLAGLIVGAALTMDIDTPLKVFGYPVLSLLLFVIAAGGGLLLVHRALFQDRNDEQKAKWRR